MHADCSEHKHCEASRGRADKLGGCVPGQHEGRQADLGRANGIHLVFREPVLGEFFLHIGRSAAAVTSVFPKSVEPDVDDPECCDCLSGSADDLHIAILGDRSSEGLDELSVCTRRHRYRYHHRNQFLRLILFLLKCNKALLRKGPLVKNPLKMLPPDIKIRLPFLVAGFMSFLFSVYLYFALGEENAGIFVGLWVPSIHSLGTLIITQARNTVEATESESISS